VSLNNVLFDMLLEDMYGQMHLSSVGLEVTQKLTRQM